MKIPRSYRSRDYKTFLGIAIAWMVLTVTQLMFQTNYLMDVATYSQTLSTNHIVELQARSLLRQWQDNAPTIVDNIKPLPKPNATSPFVFFHNRKCGGSSLRWILFNATKRLGLEDQSWIPCCTDECIPYSLPPHEPRKAVYASHVNYASLVQTLREAPITPQTNMTDETLATGKIAKLYSLPHDESFGGCITNLRSTVSRVVSCWNFRMVQERIGNPDTPPLPTAKKLTAADWANLLPKAYDQYSNGCNNEVFRIMGSSIDETYINTMSPSRPSFLYEFNTTAHHLSKCIVVMGERCEESNKVLAHFLPWLGKFDLCGVSVQSSTLRDKSKILQSKASEVILQYNRMDDLLFQFGETLFELQLRAAMNSEDQEEDDEEEEEEEDDLVEYDRV